MGATSALSPQVVQYDDRTVCLKLRTPSATEHLHLSWHQTAARLCLGPPPSRGAVSEAFAFGGGARSCWDNSITPECCARQLAPRQMKRPGPLLHLNIGHLLVQANGLCCAGELLHSHLRGLILQVRPCRNAPHHTVNLQTAPSMQLTQHMYCTLRHGLSQGFESVCLQVMLGTHGDTASALRFDTHNP